MMPSTDFNAEHERRLLEQVLLQPDAFRELYHHYLPRVYAYVAYRTGTRQDTEDIVADIFMRIVEALDSFEYRGDGSFAAWVFRIAHNHITNFYRHQQRTASQLSLDEIPEIRAVDATPDDALLRKEHFAQLHHLIHTLPPRRQEVITLRYFGGLRNHEIAAVLGLDQRTVASHLSRALDDLQQKYVWELEKEYRP